MTGEGAASSLARCALAERRKGHLVPDDEAGLPP